MLFLGSLGYKIALTSFQKHDEIALISFVRFHKLNKSGGLGLNPTYPPRSPQKKKHYPFSGAYHQLQCNPPQSVPFRGIASPSPGAHCASHASRTKGKTSTWLRDLETNLGYLSQIALKNMQLLVLIN